MGHVWKRAASIALLASALLAGSFLALSPAWESYRERGKEAELTGMIRRAAEMSGEMDRQEDVSGEILPKDSGRTVSRRPVKTGDLSSEEPTEREETAERREKAGENPEGIGILTIPKICAELPVTAGVSEQQLQVSEGWVTQSSPVGSAGNAVIAGHRSYTYGRHFNRLGELEAGDEIFYTGTGEGEMRFLVSEVLVVEPDDAAVFEQPPEGVARLTLYTCTPVRVASHRLIVRAERVE